jgi:geranylgeranyl diphosphate synthase type II
MFDLNAYLVAKQAQVNKALNELLQHTFHADRLIDAIKYSLLAGGKRLRPVLCLAASEAVGGSSKEDNITRAACALEMIHTYSLIHDDLPAMDNDNMRRGIPTCHVAFDEATAILAGDALLTLAFQILSSIKVAKEESASKWFRVIHLISLAAGCNGMVAGQMIDMASEGNRLALNDLEKMYHLKTGVMIEASTCSGAIIGNGSVKQIEQLRIYSKNIGLAFQVADDILNIEGDSVVMGKATGTDKTRNKSTYPAIMGIKESKEYAEKLVNNALQALEYFDNKADPLRAIARYVIERKR